jgi:flavoprotein
MSILWCITGAGHLLDECVEKIEELSKTAEVTVVFSDAGYEVALMYGLFDRIKNSAAEIILEKNQRKSSPFVGRLYKKEFEKVIVAPCTANTTAKVVHGIADSLVTNIVAQSGKAGTPVYILPTDAVKALKTKLPSGKEITIHCRDIDIENTKLLSKIEGITVLKDLEESI